MAGQVEATGKDVTRFQPGDEVMGTGEGSFAEYARAREDKLAPKPANLTFEQAAAVPISASTALQAVRDKGQVQPGQKVLIIGASGGVGTFAVQLAKAFGAEVTGVCSTAKVDLVRSIGADHVIDYTREDFADGGQRYDLILDIGGNRSISHLRRALSLGNPSSSWAAKAAAGGSAAWNVRSGPCGLTVRAAETEDVRGSGALRGAASPERTHRGRQDHTGHRPDLPAEPGRRRHPVSRGRRPRQDRHHRLTRTTVHTSRSGHRGQRDSRLGSGAVARR